MTMAKRSDKAEGEVTPRPMGRPPIYRSSFCHDIIELGRAGKSQAQMAAYFGVAKATITQWAQQHEEFSNALAQARAFSQEWWENKGQENLENRDFNGGLWLQMVKSRFREDYGDRSALDLPGKSGQIVIAWNSDDGTD